MEVEEPIVRQVLILQLLPSGTGSNPGTNGTGAPQITSNQCGGGGGGFYSAGGNDIYYYTGGSGFWQGGGGGGTNNSYGGASSQLGGYGGGAAADVHGSCYAYAGNGGGYSGGSATVTSNSVYAGQAGGSYNGGTNQSNTAGYNSGNGLVIITWNAGYCLSSTRTSVQVIVNPPANPINVTLSPSVITCGGYTNLNATASNGIIRWWSASTGGTMIGSSVSGANFTIYPPGATTVYYAESFTTCSSPQRIPDTAYFSTTVGPVAVASPSTICTGGVSNLVALAPGNLIRWFDSPYGGTLLATEQSGANYSVFPTTATTYYAEGYIGSSGSQTFYYSTSNYITWTVPLGAMSVNIDVSAAQGGTYSVGYGSGGQGGRVQTTLNTIPGQILYINIGQQGQSSFYGGWWGGGNGGSSNSAGGGGGTDIRVGGTSVSNRVIVAGAGGGIVDIQPALTAEVPEEV